MRIIEGEEQRPRGNASTYIIRRTSRCASTHFPGTKHVREQRPETTSAYERKEELDTRQKAEIFQKGLGRSASQGKK